MDDKLTLEECYDTFHLKKTNFTENQSIVVSIKKQWMEEFKPLLKYYIDNHCENYKISSEELHGLYIFFIEGYRIKKTLDYVNKEELDKLFNIQNPFNIDSKNIKKMTEMGPFLYQINHFFETIKYKMSIFFDRYEKVFYASDPIQWFINNNNSYSLLTIPENNNISDFYTRISEIENKNLDCILQE